MSIKAEEASRILGQMEESLERTGISYDLCYADTNKSKTHYRKVRLMSRALPLPPGDSVEYRLAEEIGRRYDVYIVVRDFGRSEDETVDGYAYAFDCTRKRDIESAFHKLMDAGDELERRRKKMIDSILSD